MNPNTTFYEEGSFPNMTVNSSSFPPNATNAPAVTPPQGWSQLYILLTVLFFSLIIAAGLFGNSLVMATLTRWQEMRTPCNLLIANICASDLGVCVFAAPLRVIEIFRGWIFGDVLCYILTPLQDVFVVVSVVTQTVIALERHRAIVAPFKPKMTLKRVKVSLLVIWFACYLTAGVPMILFLKNMLYNNGLYYCFPVFSEDGYRIAYEMYLVVLFIVFPLLIQCAAYFDVIRVLRAKDEIQSRCAGSFQQNSLQKRSFDDRIRQKKRLVRMLLVLMLAFQVCYLPRGVIMLMQEFTPETTSQPKFLYVELITLAMYYLKHVINPLILWAMSHDFRAGCLRICSVDDSHLSFLRRSHYSTVSYRGKTHDRKLRNYNSQK